MIGSRTNTPSQVLHMKIEGFMTVLKDKFSHPILPMINQENNSRTIGDSPMFGSIMIKWIVYLSSFLFFGIFQTGFPYNWIPSVLTILTICFLSNIWDSFLMQKYGNFQSALLEGTLFFIFLLLYQYVLLNEGIEVLKGISSSIMIMIFEIIHHRWRINRSLHPIPDDRD
jgi:hypothetical protein